MLAYPHLLAPLDLGFTTLKNRGANSSCRPLQLPKTARRRLGATSAHQTPLLRSN